MSAEAIRWRRRRRTASFALSRSRYSVLHRMDSCLDGRKRAALLNAGTGSPLPIRTARFRFCVGGSWRAGATSPRLRAGWWRAGATSPSLKFGRARASPGWREAGLPCQKRPRHAKSGHAGDGRSCGHWRGTAGGSARGRTHGHAEAHNSRRRRPLQALGFLLWRLEVVMETAVWRWAGARPRRRGSGRAALSEGGWLLWCFVFDCRLAVIQEPHRIASTCTTTIPLLWLVNHSSLAS